MKNKKNYLYLFFQTTIYLLFKQKIISILNENTLFLFTRQKKKIEYYIK